MQYAYVPHDSLELDALHAAPSAMTVWHFPPPALENSQLASQTTLMSSHASPAAPTTGCRHVPFGASQ
jgi:hypothetical protein